MVDSANIRTYQPTATYNPLTIAYIHVPHDLSHIYPNSYIYSPFTQIYNTIKLQVRRQP